jgi:hypothetical protein
MDNNVSEKPSPKTDRILFVAAIFVMVYCLWAGARGLNVAMGIAAFLSLSLLFFANLNKFATFKASAKGIEATTRELARETKDTLKELRELATIVSKIQISLLVRQGRLGGYKEEAQQAFRDEIISLLDKIGVPKQAQMEVLADVRRFALHDYVLHILGAPHMPQELALHMNGPSEWSNLTHHALDTPPATEELTGFLTKYSLLTDDRKELIKDYQYYRDHNKHRRPDIWKQLNSGGTF